MIIRKGDNTIMNINLYICILLTIMVIGTIITFGYLLYHITNSNNETKKLQKTIKPSTPTVLTNMSYTSIMDIIDKMIHFEVSNTILKNGLRIKTDEELSVILDNYILSISETVYTSISNDLLTVVQYYITDNYLKSYIKDTTRVILVANLMSSVGNVSTES